MGKIATDDVEELHKWMRSIVVPSGMQDRLVCSCSSRLISASRRKRRDAMTAVAALTIIHLAISFAALNAHKKHISLTKRLYGA